MLTTTNEREKEGKEKSVKRPLTRTLMDGPQSKEKKEGENGGGGGSAHLEEREREGERERHTHTHTETAPAVLTKLQPTTGTIGGRGVEGGVSVSVM